MSPIIQINFDNNNYPRLLAQVADPPKQLYCRGNLELLNSECIAVVGTRKLTSYGKEAAQKVTAGLAQAGFTIVSGLALGIDAIAHQTTLDNDGKTIAVLGGGVDDKSISPQTNFKLAMDILKNDGLITSEYPKGFHPNEKTFPQRNRIISGLSKGVLVIEADEKSGALITAKCALDQNRDVFAVPGSIFSPKSFGPNALISNGAKLISTVHDIIDEYTNLKLNLFTSGSRSSDSSYNHKIISELSLSGAKNPIQKSIINILEDKGELLTDEIISYLPNLNTSDILSSLSVLEINGLIKLAGSGKYRRS